MYVAPNSVGGGLAQFYPQLVFLAAPTACTMRSLAVNAVTTTEQYGSVVADSNSFLVLKNEQPTSMTCSISNNTSVGATYSCSDSTHTFAVAQGDRIAIEFTDGFTDGSEYNIIIFGTTLVCN